MADVSPQKQLRMSSRPGLKARITKKGLNYAADVAVQKLCNQMRDLEIPCQEGKSGDFRFNLKDARTTSFQAPNSSIELLHNAGLQWRLSGACCSMRGRLQYTFKKGKYLRLSHTVDLKAELKDLDLCVTFTVGCDSNGRPNIQSQSCSCDIRSVNIKVHGLADVLYNAILRLFRHDIKKILEEQVSRISKTAIDRDAARALAKIPVMIELKKKFLLDYRFISSPSFQTDYLDTFHKGEVYWKEDQNDAPFEVPEMTSDEDSSKMLYLWVSDHLFNTMAYNAHQHGELAYNFKLKDLPGADKEVLNTSLSSMMERLIPQKQPDDTIELEMKTVEPPTITSSREEINVKAKCQFDFYSKSAKDGTKTHFLRLTAKTTTASLRLWIEDKKIYAKVNLPISVDGVQTNAIGIGGPPHILQGPVLNIIIQTAVVKCVEEKLNELGKKGFPLPISEDVTFQNTELKMEKDMLLIATDVTYKAN